MQEKLIQEFADNYKPDMVELLANPPVVSHGDGWWTPYYDNQNMLDIKTTIASIKHARDSQALYEYGVALNRQFLRMRGYKKELLEAVHKFRAIWSCKHGFKEELIATAWHPRRVERILAQGGWDLLDNLLGC